MTLKDLYVMEQIPGQKSKYRITCTQSTKSYPDFEGMRNKEGVLFFYFVDVPAGFGGNVKRKADKAFTKVGSISSIFIPDIKLLFGYGDIQNTQDALLIVHNENYTRFEIYIARGQRNNRAQLYNLLTDGELSQEMEYLKTQLLKE